jgi:hypothetical protein
VLLQVAGRLLGPRGLRAVRVVLHETENCRAAVSA